MPPTPAHSRLASNVSASAVRSILILRCSPAVSPGDRQRLAPLAERLAGLVRRVDSALASADGASGGTVLSGDLATELRGVMEAARPLIRELCAPSLFAGLESAIAKALAPFFDCLPDAAELARQCPAWAALETHLGEVASADPARLPSQAEAMLETARGLLGGVVEWSYYGAEVA